MDKSKVKSFFLSPLFLMAAELVLSAAIAVGAIFFPYANVIIYRLWKIVLIDLTFVLCCGGLFTLAYFERNPDGKALGLILSFLIGAGVFSALYFGSMAILRLYVNPTVACIAGVSVALAFDLACVIAADLFATKRDRKFFVWATTALTLLFYVGSMLLSLAILPHGWAFKAFSEDEHLFSRATAETYAITERDRNAGRAFLTETLAGSSPAFDFCLEGKSFARNLSDWKAETVKEETNEEGDLALIRTFTHSSGVEARVEGAYYDETATVEWTVYVTNKGAARSAILSDLYALSASLPISSPTLYFSGGSNEANDDFALYSRELHKKEYVFDTIKGRTSMLYLPFFNLVGKEGGATLGVGWSGEWTAAFSTNKETHVRVGQSVLEGYLDPGETVRTPLVSLCLYEGNNALKGFNNFRADILRGLPDGYVESSMLMFAGAEGQDDTSRANAEGAKAYIEALKEAGVLDLLDYAWHDAAWYDTKGTGDWRATIGDWIVDPAKYPEGLGAVSTYLQGNGVETLLWYEPERVPLSSDLYKAVAETAGRERWIIHPTNGSSDGLWNMGDAAAREFMIERIVSSLKENSVIFYRQDYNIDPKTYWASADRELYDLRKGFAENFYVMGEYAFLDALTEAIPGLLIDNCASGGRRVDLEMCRRAVPLWRSDYQCKKEKSDLSEASQYQLYGLSLWLPYSSITNPNATSEYDLRSLLGGYVMCYADILFDARDAYVKFIREYDEIKTYFAEKYYPLTVCTPRENFVAMQFGTEKKGVILAYAREGAKSKQTLLPNGLSAEKSYTLRTIEGGAVAKGKGSALLESGFSLSVKEKTAYIILYEEG